MLSRSNRQDSMRGGGFGLRQLAEAAAGCRCATLPQSTVRPSVLARGQPLALNSLIKPLTLNNKPLNLNPEPFLEKNIAVCKKLPLS